MADVIDSAQREQEQIGLAPLAEPHRVHAGTGGAQHDRGGRWRSAQRPVEARRGLALADAVRERRPDAVQVADFGAVLGEASIQSFGARQGPDPVLPLGDRMRALQSDEPVRRARGVALRRGQLAALRVVEQREVGGLAGEEERPAILDRDAQHARPPEGGELERVGERRRLERGRADSAPAAPLRTGGILDRVARAVAIHEPVRDHAVNRRPCPRRDGGVAWSGMGQRRTGTGSPRPAKPRDPNSPLSQSRSW